MNKTYIFVLRGPFTIITLYKQSFKFIHIVMSVCQVQDVVGVMRNNIDKVLERDSKLNDLDHR